MTNFGAFIIRQFNEMFFSAEQLPHFFRGLLI